MQSITTYCISQLYKVTKKSKTTVTVDNLTVNLGNEFK